MLSWPMFVTVSAILFVGRVSFLLSAVLEINEFIEVLFFFVIIFDGEIDIAVFWFF